MITIIAFTVILITILIVHEVHVDKIKTGDYVLWYTNNDKRTCINISEKMRDIFLN